MTKSISTHHRRVIRVAHPSRYEPERLPLHSAHALDERLLSNALAIAADGTAHVLAHHFVDIQHVQVDATQLEDGKIAFMFMF